MNRTQTIAVALLVVALPFASAAYAADRGHGDRDNGHQDHARGHDYGHDRHGYRGKHGHDHYRHGYHGHHYKHHYRHGHHLNAGHYGHGAQVMLPFPPLPPFPVIVLNKKLHAAHVVLRRPY